MKLMMIQIYNALRSPRLKAASTVLLLLLQRTPVLKILVEAESGAALGVPQILRSAVVAVAALGAVDTVTGATTFVSNPDSPVNATSGEAFAMVFSITGSESAGGGAHSWTITGPLPPGLSITGATAAANDTFKLNSATGSITGTPTEAGTWDITFKAWEKANQGGESWDTEKLGPLPVVRIEVSASGALVFTSQPMSTSVAVGKTFNVGVTTSGDPVPTLQWRKDGTPIDGATGEIFSIGSVQLEDGGSYDVVATNSGGSITSDAAILTVTAPAAITTQPASQEVSAGGSATFSVTATGAPAPTYQWRKNGQSISGATQSTLTLDPVSAGDVGSYTVRVQNATKTVTSDAAELTLAGAGPAVTDQPVAQQVADGGTATFSVVATGDPAPTFQWLKDGQEISGATQSSLTINPVGADDVGSYAVRLENATGTVTSSTAELTLQSMSGPEIQRQPQTQTVAPGGGATFQVDAGSGPGVTYQWRRDGAEISGATGARLDLSNVQAADAGTYTVVVSSGGTSTESAGAVLALNVAGDSRLGNLSTRTRIGTDATLIPGFVVEGTGQAPVLIRAVGPTLGSLGVSGVLADPRMRLVSAGVEQTTNDDWGQYADQSDLEATRQRVGAFALEAGSADAALVISLGSGPHTVPTTGAEGTSGVVLVELYDAGTAGPEEPRLVNLSARSQVGTGSDLLIPGFVIQGDVAKTVLIRAVGPTLGDFGVPGVLEDPVMGLFSGAEELANNDDWGSGDQAANIMATAVRVGAFAIDQASKDSALLITLSPGAYTVQVAGVGDTTGECLVEVYDVPPE